MFCRIAHPSVVQLNRFWSRKEDLKNGAQQSAQFGSVTTIPIAFYDKLLMQFKQRLKGMVEANELSGKLRDPMVSCVKCSVRFINRFSVSVLFRLLPLPFFGKQKSWFSNQNQHRRRVDFQSRHHSLKVNQPLMMNV